MFPEVKLKVVDAKWRDFARGIARIDMKTMRELGVSSGDVIEIIGKRRTSAIAWPAYSEDQGKGIIRIDGPTRANAGTSVEEYVTVRKADVRDAESITLAPVDTRLRVDENFIKFVKNRLMERTFVEGDTTRIMMRGHPVEFTVVKTEPEGVVKLTRKTELHIQGKTVKKRENVVMTRLSDDDLKYIDMLIGIGLFDSRSEAVAYLTHEGIKLKRELFEQLSEKLRQINKIREEAKVLLETSTPKLSTSNLKECPKCGSKNSPEARFCSNCGEKL